MKQGLQLCVLCLWNLQMIVPVKYWISSICWGKQPACGRPVFKASKEVEYYLPKGKWVHLLDGRTLNGERWVKETYDYFSLPLFVRPDSVLVVGTNDIDTVYDYGCADGSLLKMVGEICPSMKLTGYDISQEMIDIAKQNVPNADYLSTYPKSNLHNTVLNASSVFHEIHAYSPDVKWDYQNIFNSGATYIAIRDMFLF